MGARVASSPLDGGLPRKTDRSAPASRVFRGLLSVHSRFGLHARWITKRDPFHQRLRRTCYLLRRSDCFRLERPVAGWDLHPLEVAAFARRTIFGHYALTAMTLFSEIDDIRRFRSPRALMAYLGLVPTEKSSGEKERKGSITKAGNSHARRVLVEAAWNNRHRAGADLILRRRRQGQSPEAVAIAIKAQHRVSRKFHRLWQRKHPNVAVVAVARELCGFVWAIMKAAPQY